MSRPTKHGRKESAGKSSQGRAPQSQGTDLHIDLETSNLSGQLGDARRDSTSPTSLLPTVATRSPFATQATWTPDVYHERNTLSAVVSGSSTNWPTQRVSVAPYATASTSILPGSTTPASNQAFVGVADRSPPFDSSRSQTQDLSPEVLPRGRGRGKYIGPQDTKERLPILDKSYRLFNKKEFKEGKVIGVMFSESAGANAIGYNDAISHVRYNGHQVHTQARRFVVVRLKREYCYACPIFTYADQATRKRGVVPSEHGIAYSVGRQPTLLPEETGITKPSIPVRMTLATEPPLNTASRIYYGITHPIQYNIKVKDVGQVPDEYIPSLIGNWKEEDEKESEQDQEVTTSAHALQTLQPPPSPADPYASDPNFSPASFHPQHNAQLFHPQANRSGYHPSNYPYGYHPYYNRFGHHPSLMPQGHYVQTRPYDYDRQFNEHGYDPQWNPCAYHPVHNERGYHPQFSRFSYHQVHNPTGYHQQGNPAAYHPRWNPQAPQYQTTSPINHLSSNFRNLGM